MIYAKTTTYGLESQIKRLQNWLNDKLTWLGTIEIYGKIQKTNRDGRIIPEVYVSGNEYKNILINDNVSASVGFLINSKTIENSQKKANVDIVFTVNLVKIHENNYRDDEKSLIEAEKIINSSGITLVNGDIKEGIEQVFAGFDIENLKHRDMQPWYVFSLNCEINYNNDICLRN
jgi:hypothetical protein